MTNVWDTRIENVLDPLGICRACACACVIAIVFPLATLTAFENTAKKRRRG